MRIGLMGGTFNPIHVGHLISVNEVVALLALDKVLLVPCALPPHKGHRQLISARHRLAMATLAATSNERLEVSSMEIERGGRSYTIDTIRTIKEAAPAGQELYFIVGVDVFADIATWKDVKGLLTSCHFVVTNRPGYSEGALLEKLRAEVTARHPSLRFNLKAGAAQRGVGEVSLEGSPYSIFLVKIPSLEISSTEIRRRVAEGRPIRYLVPQAVEEYIIKHRLYRRGG